MDLAELRRLRATEPDLFLETAGQRRRAGPVLPSDGRLVLIAVDHPARGALGVGDDPMAMADRGELLERVVMASPTRPALRLGGDPGDDDDAAFDGWSAARCSLPATAMWPLRSTSRSTWSILAPAQTRSVQAPPTLGTTPGAPMED